MWLNKKGITNRLLIPKLEGYRYRVTYDTIGGWIVQTPEGNPLVFKRDTGLCNCMS